MSKQTGRRNFIRSIIALLAFAALLLFDVPYRVRRKLQSKSSDSIAGCIPELYGPRDAEAIGRAYLAMVPQEADREILLGYIFGGGAGEATGRTGNCAEQLALVSETARRDYESGDVLLAAGWQISRTEARLCALTVTV